MTAVGQPFDCWDALWNAWPTRFEGRDLKSIQAHQLKSDSDDNLTAEEVLLGFGDSEISLRSDENDCQIIPTTRTSTDPRIGFTPIDELRRFFDRPVIWYWNGQNSQGYRDVFMLSFGGEDSQVVSPELSFSGNGHDISIFLLTPLQSRI